jgi:hypothetical protein
MVASPSAAAPPATATFHGREEHYLGAVAERSFALGDFAVHRGGEIGPRGDADRGEQIAQGGPGGQGVSLGSVGAPGLEPADRMTDTPIVRASVRAAS